MRDAKAAMRGKWGNAALVTLIYVLIAGGLGWTFIGPLILIGPLEVGYALYIMSVKTTDKPRVETMFQGFADFARSMVAGLLFFLFVFLWMLLLIVPGIIMSFAYAMVFFILAEDKNISAADALRRSRSMMRGYKWKYFCLMMRFIGWVLLCVVTFGILALWIQPYVYMARLNFYNDVKAEWEANNSNSNILAEAGNTQDTTGTGE